MQDRLSPKENRQIKRTFDRPDIKSKNEETGKIGGELKNGGFRGDKSSRENSSFEKCDKISVKEDLLKISRENN